MFHSRALLASLLATISLLSGAVAQAQVGIEPVQDQTIPSGKTLVVPIPASDPGGPARTYTVTVGQPTVSGTTTPATNAGINAVVRTGDPHLIMAVSYSDTSTTVLSGTVPVSTPVISTGTMEFQLLREYAPQTSKIIAGLTQGGFYSPTTSGTTTKYITFHRVLQGQIIQGGDPNGDGSGGPGFSFPNEYNRALIFSGTLGQLAMANAGSGVGNDQNGTNGSQFFVTLYNPRQYDFQYTLFGQLLRGYDTLNGIAATPVQDNGSGEVSSPVTPVDIVSATVTQNNTDAVLLLSATGVCDAPITITATTVSGGTVTTATTGFIAHAVADSTDDPSFIQPSPPDITAPNGSVKVPISATDLQLDLIAYGFQRIRPAADTGETTGTSPTLTVPLVSSTDNSVAAIAGQWILPSGATDSARLFHVGAGAKAMTGKLAAIPLGAGHLDLGSAPPLAVIDDSNPQVTGSNLTATVIWGDGSPPAVTGTAAGDVSIVKTAAGRFSLIAPHDYKSPGEFPIIVRVADIRGARLELSGTANIGPSALVISGYDVTSKTGILKNQLLATFQDNGGSAPASAYTTLINWGDGTITSGTVRKTGLSSFQLLGTHTYSLQDAFTIASTVTRTGTYSASAWTTATVTGTVGRQVYPPFPQIHLAQMWSTIYSDSNNILTTGSDGGSPYAGVIQGSDGNFYGTAVYGGTSGYGTVYEVSSSGSFNTLYNFSGGADGGNPYGGLIEDGTTGTFYGTTSFGGANGFGTIYSITNTGTFTTLHSFAGSTDGAYPMSGLVADGTTSFYGTTGTGGPTGYGTVFSITKQGSLNTIYSFSGGTNGGDPAGGVITGTDGNLYGTTEIGGTNSVGTIFKLTPGGAITTLHTFTTGTNDGNSPAAGLVIASDSNFYGTTLTGGTSGYGTVFQLTTSGSYQSIYSFGGGGDGANPYAPLIDGTDGALYGTTRAGGYSNAGVAYGITYTGTESVLYTFNNGPDGGHPDAPLVAGTDGFLYGTAETGGTAGYGAVYQITGPGAENTIYSFGSGRAFQYSLRTGINLVNSGNKPLLSGSGTFSVYVDPSGTLDGNQTIFTSGGQSVFPIPALKPGQSYGLRFSLAGSFSDTRLKLPLNFDPSGQVVIGVVTYSDPVANFDGSLKIENIFTINQ